MKKIWVQGYFNNNLGDDLLLKSLIDYFPKTSFYIRVNKKYVDNYNQMGENLKAIPNNLFYKILQRSLTIVKMPRLAKKMLYPFDAFVELGGSIFQQHSANDTVDNIRRSILLSQKHYFIIGSNFGPVLTPQYVDDYRTFFGKVDGVTFRDLASFRLFSKIKTVSIAPDVAFNLNVNFKTDCGSKPYVIISPINMRFKDRILTDQYLTTSKTYEQELARLAEVLINFGYDIKLLAFSQSEGDGQAAERIFHLISDEIKDHVSVHHYKNLHETLELIAGADRLISGRFHAMILGWLLGKPQLVIKYSEKTTNVIEDLFSKQFSVEAKNLKSISSVTLIKRMNTMDDVTLINTKDKANGQFKQLAQFLKS
ncbi:polysaccharide pyruvyl transferase family protein [Lactiplantibacillus plantarum]|uniref:polysaccharide pyruvyl transferase family protein n=1 Tax=Lactiplantibacillus plantarum TaxID=1590 RepID=UPI0013307809|nr:polysaccharide pyruvyl transferase family protein [Lactiplantibacillus plantarum]UJL23456.1 polysaccharide pyruvyl transferase family protein [Lactiplantibacillus plantarum]